MKISQYDTFIPIPRGAGAGCRAKLGCRGAQSWRTRCRAIWESQGVMEGTKQNYGIIL